ncbi:hypothetical protein A7A76_07805 [Lysobacter enzymogenes]|uniref:HK97 gp10 family phage protein n=1 Tax=Lysobacter enzymogenes TaxID=69 RepID=UPI0019D2EDD1|nr:HK97 gp10 family phage protein [Lysobacter enzymogenes]MBN7138998.1 hypothetical protein [Lysobacter enzymogenes]
MSNTKAITDFSSAMAGLENLAEAKVGLARSMAVAGGKVIRDEAKLRAPVGNVDGSHNVPGALRAAIYLAHRDGQSGESRQVYQVSWNAKRAPHGHLVEFGHWQTHAAYLDAAGEWRRGAPLPVPKWVAAKPFLRPAYDAAMPRAREAMLARGSERLAEILASQPEKPDEL